MKLHYNVAKIGCAFALILTFVSPVKVQADTLLGLYFSASHWQPDFSGDMNYDGSDINIEDQLNIEDDSSTVFSIALEHPIPLLPNIKLQRTTLDTSSIATLGSDLTFGGITFPDGTQLQSLLDFSHTDYILYYELLDNWVSLDLGINVINFDGNIILESEGLNSDLELDEFVPTLYGKASFELPLTGAYLGAEGSIIGSGDAAISDYKVFVGWESDFGLGAELGLHRFGADWEDIEDSHGDLVFDGYYASVIFHF